tara:strand:+ start:8474 stop:8917 length:444 start_codon:yes stop_codon:yes gene_type:complete
MADNTSIRQKSTTTPAIAKQLNDPSEVTEVDLKEIAGLEVKEEKPLEEGQLITFDQLTMNFLQQHHDTMEEYVKLQEALDNMHYTSTITRISLEDLQDKKDHLNKLTGAIEAMALYKKHVDPNCTDRDFVFNDEDNTPVPDTTVDSE